MLLKFTSLSFLLLLLFSPFLLSFSLFIFHLIECSFSLKTEKVTALADTIRVVLRAVPVDSSDTQVCTLCFLIMSCSLALSMRASIFSTLLFVCTHVALCVERD